MYVCVYFYIHCLCKQFGTLSTAMMPKQSARTHITPTYQCSTHFYLFSFSRDYLNQHAHMHALQIGALASAIHKYELLRNFFQMRKYSYVWESSCLPPGRIRNTHEIHGKIACSAKFWQRDIEICLSRCILQLNENFFFNSF